MELFPFQCIHRHMHMHAHANMHTQTCSHTNLLTCPHIHLPTSFLCGVGAEVITLLRLPRGFSTHLYHLVYPRTL